jgi:ribosomal protein S18 acetylase RimI-like enzyme
MATRLLFAPVTRSGDDRRGRDASSSDGDASGDGEVNASDVRIELGDVSLADEVADLWVELADDQRVHGSHLLPAANRELARQAAAQHGVTGGLLVARDGDDLVGFVTFSTESGDYDQDADRGLIHDLYVRAPYRDHGVGSRLLRGAEKRLAAEGVDAVSLEAMVDNVAARRFYCRHGYETFRVELEKPLESDSDSKRD